MQLRNFFFLFLMLLASGRVHAQTNPLDSSNADIHGNTYYYFNDRLNIFPINEFQPDSSIRAIQKFDDAYLQNLGITGSPTIPLIPQFNIKPGFQTGMHIWDIYRITAENTPYYNTQNPYTRLFYTQGNGTFQQIRGLHTQNILPNWNAAIFFDKLNNKGFYFDQNVNHSKVGLSSNYQSLNRRYKSDIAFIYNGFKFNETGGIKSDSTFLNPKTGSQQRLSIPARLSNASQSWGEWDINTRQNIFFGKTESYQKNDSDSVISRYIVPKFFLSYYFNFNNAKYKFVEENTNAYFDTSYYNFKGSNDSIWNRKISNEISFGHIGQLTSDSGARKLNYGLESRIYGRMEYDLFKQTAMDTITTNYFSGLEIKWDRFLNFYTHADYCIAGYNAGDYLAEIEIAKKFDSSGRKISFYIKSQKYKPEYIFQKTFLNHYRWDNHFEQSGLQEAKLTYSDSIIGKLEGSFINQNGYIYISKNLIPQQSSSAVNYLRIRLQKTFRVSNFYFENEAIYQKALETDLLQIPDWIYRGSLYYENRFFHNRLLLNVGASVGWNSKWQPYSYLPGISLYAKQDSIETGNYPVMDFWVAAKIKSLSFFFKLEHLNEGFSGYNYFTAPYYPMQPRTYRLGIRWAFFN